MHALLLALIMALSAPPSPPVASPQTAIPDSIWPQGFAGSHPIWVSAEAAVTRTGEVDPRALDSRASDMLQQLFAETPAGECVHIGSMFECWMHVPLYGSLEAASAESKIVVVGRVEARRFGFFYGTPGQLLEITVTEAYRRARGESRSAYFIFMPVGDFELGGRRICKTDPRYAEPPEIGDRVLVLADLTLASDSIIWVAWPTQVVTIRRSGRVSLPARFRDAEGINANDLLDRVRSIVSESRREGP